MEARDLYRNSSNVVGDNIEFQIYNTISIFNSNGTEITSGRVNGNSQLDLSFDSATTVYGVVGNSYDSDDYLITFDIILLSNFPLTFLNKGVGSNIPPANGFSFTLISCNQALCTLLFSSTNAT